MSLVILGRGELHRVRGHHRQAHACSQLHSRRDVGFIVNPPGPLQLQVKALGKQATELRCDLKSPGRIALHQGLPHRPGLGARQGNQAFIELCKPAHIDTGLRLARAARPGAGQQF